MQAQIDGTFPWRTNWCQGAQIADCHKRRKLLPNNSCMSYNRIAGQGNSLSYVRAPWLLDQTNPRLLWKMTKRQFRFVCFETNFCQPCFVSAPHTNVILFAFCHENSSAKKFLLCLAFYFHLQACEQVCSTQANDFTDRVPLLGPVVPVHAVALILLHNQTGATRPVQLHGPAQPNWPAGHSASKRDDSCGGGGFQSDKFFSFGWLQMWKIHNFCMHTGRPHWIFPLVWLDFKRGVVSEPPNRGLISGFCVVITSRLPILPMCSSQDPNVDALFCGRTSESPHNPRQFLVDMPPDHGQHTYEGDPQSPVLSFIISKQFRKIEQK